MRTILLCALACLGGARLLDGATVTVTVSGLSFVSNNITISVGDTVHWTSLSPGHNVAQSTDAASNVYDGSGFRSGAIGAVATYDVTFNSAGDYFYICDAHAGLGMKGQVHVVVPTPTPSASVSPTSSDSPSPSPSASATPSASPSPTATPTQSPSASPSATASPDRTQSPTDSPTQSPTFSASPSFSDSPTASPSSSATPSVSPSATLTPSPSASPSHSATPTLTASATASPSPTVTPVLSATPTASPGGGSFAGVEDAGLLASPATGGVLRLWARLDGQPDSVELRIYSAAFSLLLSRPLPPGPGLRRWTVPLEGVPAGPIWIQLRVFQDGRERRGPVLRSYVIR